MSLSNDKAQLLSRRKKGGLWNTDYEYTVYTAKGTALDSFHAKEREIVTKEALNLYYDELEASGVKGVARRSIDTDEGKTSLLALAKTVTGLASNVSSLFSSPSSSTASSTATSAVKSKSEPISPSSPHSIMNSFSALFTTSPKTSPAKQILSPRKIAITPIAEEKVGESETDDVEDALLVQGKCHHGRPIADCRECQVTVAAKQTKKKKKNKNSDVDLKYMRMTETLGGKEAVSVMSEKWLTLAER